MTGKATMAWVDLETTGLSANWDVPLELGVVLTDNHLNEIDSAEWIIGEESEVYRIGLERGHANQFVQPMHENSGLWKDFYDDRIEKMSRVEVDRDVCQFLQDNGVKYGTLPLCGNSVGSLDRPFIITHLPLFNEALSHRQIDISSFYEVMKRVNPELEKNLESVLGVKSDSKHRVMSDIRQSILQYKTYLDEFIITGDDY